MKPAPFRYHLPRSEEEAVAILAGCGEEETRILAGGQTLVPAMALRLARPAHIVDINRVAGFERLRRDGDGLRISPCVRHAELGRDAAPGPLGRLLEAVRDHIAHHPIRIRGTFCGSLANADPAAEWCLAAVTLGAELTLRSARGQRAISADDFFLGYMTTALEPDEILAEARLPDLAADTKVGFYEFARRSGDFAQAMAIATFRVRDGIIAEARIGIGAIDSRPRRVAEAEAVIEGQAPTAALFAAAAEAGAAAIVPDGGYRAALAEAAIRRSLSGAA